MIAAILRATGTWPVAKESLIIAVIEGHKHGRQFFRTSVGRGSREHVDELIDMTSFKTLHILTVTKLENEVESEFLE